MRLLRSPRAAVLIALLSCLGLFAGSATAGAAPQHPVVWDFRAAIPGAIEQTLDPSWAPPGANDPDCEVTEEHPNPVVLLHATSTAKWAYSAGAPYLANQGFCVYTFNYGNITPMETFPLQGLADIEVSAREVSRHIDRIMAETGAEKVDLVGWSQGGGMLPHYYINFLGGDKKVDNVIGIAPGNHGTTGDMLVYVRYFLPPLGEIGYKVFEWLFPAFAQQAQYHELVEKVYGDGDTRPGPHYTTIVSKYDEIATPHTNQLLDGPNVTNILLQDECAKDLSEHLSINFSPRTWHHVANALSPQNATPVPCVQVDPFYPGMSDGR